MKLAPWSEAVKPDPGVLWPALCAAFVTALGLLFAWTQLDPRTEQMERFGATTATALAELCMEPLLKQDRLHLGVIGNRLTELDAIAAVATYTVDQQLLTLSGTMTGPQYAASITIDGTVVGHVRVALDPAAFAGGITAPDQRLAATAATLGISVGAGLLAAFGAALLRAWRTGALVVDTPALRQRLRRRLQPEPPPEELPTAPEAPPEPPEPIRHYLLGINLYNQLSLKGVEREFELSLCTELAETVAIAYQGQVVSLPGLGALIDFDHTDSDARAFDVACAGFALARLLRDEAPFGIYRLGLHLVTRPGDEPLPLDHPAVADVALLSALARDNTLVLSETMCTALAGTERLTLRPMQNVLLDELRTSGPGCQLLTDLAAADKTRLLQQVEQFKNQRDSMASESTF